MQRSEGSVVVDGIDLLGDELLDLVIEGANRRTRPQLILTSGPVELLGGRGYVEGHPAARLYRDAQVLPV